MNKKWIVWVVLAVAVLVGTYFLISKNQPASQPATGDQAAAPLTGSGSVSSPKPTTGGKLQVSIRGFAFQAQSTKVVPGTTIEWKNFDDVNHQIIGGNFQSPVLAPGQSYSYKFIKEGTYIYYDGLHQDTQGEIVVKNSNF
ncbi:MAG: cupredoxin domain-containing protein [bacterium]|nr:cupredoxin domain-containing protein [bacterium]